MVADLYYNSGHVTLGFFGHEADGDEAVDGRLVDLEQRELDTFFGAESLPWEAPPKKDGLGAADAEHASLDAPD
jgi:hypothetical protein